MSCFSSLLNPFSMTSSSSTPPSVDLLILGAGWTYTFLSPHLTSHHPTISFSATTRDGRDKTIKWSWDANKTAEDNEFERLPKAGTVVIVFPLKGVGLSKALVEGYERIHGKARWIQLGSSGIWDGGPTVKSGSGGEDEKRKAFEWTTRHSPYDSTNERAKAEEELLSIHSDSYVLNLSGLWGGTRDPINWIPRVAGTKEALAGKGSIHLIHGLDVARAIIAVHLAPPSYSPPSTSLMDVNASQKKGASSRRYLLTDLRVYDWWDLISAWGLHPSSTNTTTSSTLYSPGSNGHPLIGFQPLWVIELMQERNIRALPRTPEELGRALDSRDFWRDFGLMPIKGRLERGRL